MHLDQGRRVGVDPVGEVRQRGAAGQPDDVAVAARDLHAADGRRRHVVELLPPLLLALAAADRTPAATAAERTGRAAAATAAAATGTATGAAAEAATGRRRHRRDRRGHRHRRRHRHRRPDRRDDRHRRRHRDRRGSRHRRRDGRTPAAAGTAGRRDRPDGGPPAGRPGIMPGLGRGPPGPGPGRGPGRGPPGPAEPPGRAPPGPGRGAAGTRRRTRDRPDPDAGHRRTRARAAGGRGGRPGVGPWLTPKGLLPGPRGRPRGQAGRAGLLPAGRGRTRGRARGRAGRRGAGRARPAGGRPASGPGGRAGGGRRPLGRAGPAPGSAGPAGPAGPERPNGRTRLGAAGGRSGRPPWPPAGGPGRGPGPGAPARRPGRGPGVGAPSPVGLPAAGGNASLSRRATGGSIVEDALLTNSPISLSLARTTLLSTPSSFASSCTRALPATGLLVRSRAAARSAQLVGEHTHRWRFIGCSCRFDLPDLVGGRAPCPTSGVASETRCATYSRTVAASSGRSRAMRGRTPGAAPRDRGTRDPGAGRHLDQATDDVGRARAGDRPDPPPPRHATARRPANGSGSRRRCARAPTTSDGPRTVYPAGTASRRHPAAGHIPPRAGTETANHRTPSRTGHP